MVAIGVLVMYNTIVLLFFGAINDNSLEWGPPYLYSVIPASDKAHSGWQH